MTRDSTGTASRPDPPLLASKQEWRQWSKRARRSGIPGPVSEAVTAGIISWLDGPDAPDGMVVLYLPLPDEVDVTPVIDIIDRPCAVTRTPSQGPLTLHPADSTRERHRYGFEQPVANAPLAYPDQVGVVLVPGLAFDLRGGRLGRGGGYYDRFLPTLPPGALRMGVVTESLVVEALPTEPHDAPMTHLATESGVRRIDNLLRIP